MTDPDAAPDPLVEPATPEPATIIGEPATANPTGNPPPVEPAAAPPARLNILIAVGVILFLILAAGEAWLFNARTPTDHAARLASMSSSIDTQARQIAALKSRLAALDAKIAAVAARPAPAAPSAPPSAPPPSVPASLDRKIAALQSSLASLSTTTLADHAAVTTLQARQTDLPKLVDQAKTLALVAQASLALQNGAPLGTIPNAPRALVRYVTDDPPTIGALKSAFPAYASRAAAAGGDVASHGGFWRTLKGRVESLVTIRHHAEVLVGSRAAGMLGAAQSALDRDDLAEAVTALKPLPAKAQAIMAPWTTEANHLLAARAALATMAGRS